MTSASRLTAAALLACAAVAASPTAASGMGGPQQGTGTTPDGFTLSYERPGGYTTGGSGGRVDCTYNLLPIAASIGDGSAEAQVYESQGVEELGPDGVAYRADPASGERMTLYFRSGPDCATVGPVWVSNSLTPESLIPGLRIEITKVLPLPVPNMSPMPDVGSYVNLGLWIAIEDPGPQGVRITDGPVWAEAQGTLTGFTFDPGDGTAPFDCPLTGTPYVEGSQSVDQGPCGYTYKQTSPAGAPFPLTITANYEATYTLSNGVSDSFGVIPRPDGFPYDVDEIQTVGSDR